MHQCLTEGEANTLVVCLPFPLRITAMTPPPEEMQFYNNQFCHHQQQQLHQQQKERAVFLHVTLYHSSRGLGFAIRRGHECNQMPFTISRVVDGGPAHLDGQLKVLTHTYTHTVGACELQTSIC